ncbi:MAG TPA: TrbC/VirB2 family protein [Candidatus Dormibacteraeota bacterium]|nr:TrbC/VirB2 family protein [Candidatus Dormibacteraeota bacterium]
MIRMPAAVRTAAYLFPLFAVAMLRPVLASTGGGLPWDTPLQTLQNDLTGPVATAVSVLALFAAGAALVFGEELGHLVRRALLLVVAIAFLVLGNNFLTALGLTGAVI